MKHFGDITKINGAEVPTVDIITGGSPCQDLSVAGKRAGLAGERSGLFMEQMRIVKEMRELDRANGRTGWMVRPRYMVWENVPGAFSSGNPKGADFAAVIEEIIKVAEPGASVSVCVPNGGWTKSGCYYAEDGSWSIAWRVHDAQFWGVPQRRKRIALVADFGGLSASEILFERKGLSGDSEQSGEAGKETAGAAGDGVEGAIFYDAYQHHGWRRSETSGTLTVGQNNTVRGDTPLVTAYGIDQQGGKGGANYTEDVCPPILSDSHGTPHAVACGISSYDSNAMKSSNPHSGIYEADTARTLDLNGGSHACNQGGIAVLQSVGCATVYDGQRRHNYEPFGDVCETVQAQYGTGGNNTPLVVAPTAEEHGHQPIVWNGKADGASGNGVAFATVGDHENRPTDMTNLVIGTYQTVTGALTPGAHPPAVAIGNGQLNQISMAEQANTLDTMHDQHGLLVFDKETYNCGKSCTGSPQIRVDNVAPTCRADDHPSGVAYGSVVRRLTPLECERLQGYPDGWTDIGEWVDSKGKKHKDADSPRYKALGNSIALPFWQWMARRICAQYERTVTMASLFDGIGGFPLVFQRCGAVPVWASEIEEFPIAVTKIRFPEEEQL